jgi:hypothetical protein
LMNRAHATDESCYADSSGKNITIKRNENEKNHPRVQNTATVLRGGSSALC